MNFSHADHRAGYERVRAADARASRTVGILAVATNWP